MAEFSASQKSEIEAIAEEAWNYFYQKELPHLREKIREQVKSEIMDALKPQVSIDDKVESIIRKQIEPSPSIGARIKAEIAEGLLPQKSFEEKVQAVVDWKFGWMRPLAMVVGLAVGSVSLAGLGAIAWQAVRFPDSAEIDRRLEDSTKARLAVIEATKIDPLIKPIKDALGEDKYREFLRKKAEIETYVGQIEAIIKNINISSTEFQKTKSDSEALITNEVEELKSVSKSFFDSQAVRELEKHHTAVAQGVATLFRNDPSFRSTLWMTLLPSGAHLTVSEARPCPAEFTIEKGSLPLKEFRAIGFELISNIRDYCASHKLPCQDAATRVYTQYESRLPRDALAAIPYLKFCEKK